MAAKTQGGRPEVVYFPSDMAMEVLDYEKENHEPGVVDSLRTMAVWMVWWGVVGIVMLVVLVAVVYFFKIGGGSPGAASRGGG